MAKATWSDIFIQYRTIIFAHHASDHTVLTEAYIDTGLEVRAGLGWLIHTVEFEWHAKNTGGTNRCEFALSTRRSLAAIPNFGDRGCIDKSTFESQIVGAAGLDGNNLVDKKEFRPPLIIATRVLAAYFQTSVDNTAWDGETSYVRIGYTTLKLKESDYVELSETWGSGG